MLFYKFFRNPKIFPRPWVAQVAPFSMSGSAWAQGRPLLLWGYAPPQSTNWDLVAPNSVFFYCNSHESQVITQWVQVYKSVEASESFLDEKSHNDDFWPQKSSLWLCRHSGPRNLQYEMISGPRNLPKMMISGPRKLHYDSADFWPQKSSFWDDFWPQKSSLWPREPLWIKLKVKRRDKTIFTD